MPFDRAFKTSAGASTSPSLLAGDDIRLLEFHAPSQLDVTLVPQSPKYSRFKLTDREKYHYESIERMRPGHTSPHWPPPNDDAETARLNEISSKISSHAAAHAVL